MRLIDSLPKQDGFYMPSELTEHSATWILWPDRPDTWRLGAKPAQTVFLQLILTIAKYEPVMVGVSPAQYPHVLSLNLPNVHIVEMSNTDSQVRNTGPIFVVNSEGDLRAVDWEYDDNVGSKICGVECVDRYRADDLILEGGAINTDGEGTLLVTEEYFLDPERNPGSSKEEIEQKLLNYLGAEKVLWIPEGIYDDEDVNGYVDNICRFVAPGKVVLTWEDNEEDPQHARSKKALDYLESVTDARGRKLEIIKIHVPNPIIITEEESAGIDIVEGILPRTPGDRLPASYINYYNCNGAVILPIFDDPHDQAAINILQDCFPDKKVEPIQAREILLGGANIHSVTQQVPKA